MSLLEFDTTRKRRAKKTLTKPKKFEARNNKEYEVKAIIDDMMYKKKINNKIPSFYYFVL